MKKHAVLPVIVLTAALTGCAGSGLAGLAKDHIRLTTVDTNMLSVALRFAPLADELKKTLERPVDVRSDWDTDSINVHLADDQVEDYYHLMVLDPIQFCQVSQAATLTPLAVRRNLTGADTETGLIVVPKTSTITGIKDLKGKRFAFGPYGSTTMFYNVLELFRESSMPTAFLESARYHKHSLNRHQDSLVVAQNLLLGTADVGVVTRTWFQTTTDRTFDMSELLKDKLKVIAETKPMPELVVAATDALDADERQRVKDLLITTLADRPAVLEPLHAKGFAEPDEKTFANLCRRLAAVKNLPPKPSLLPLQ